LKQSIRKEALLVPIEEWEPRELKMPPEFNNPTKNDNSDIKLNLFGLQLTNDEVLTAFTAFCSFGLALYIRMSELQLFLDNLGN